MAIIYSYPLIGELATGDTIAISDASNGNKTKSVTIGQLDSYINTGQATIIQVDDRVVTGASFNTSDGLLTLTRNGGEIPSVTTNLDGRYALTSSLATVATSGSYNDLIDKPTIPGGTNIGSTPSASNVVITSSTGSDGTVAAATQLLAGVMTAADKLKLDGIANGVTSIVAGTNVTISPAGGTGDVTINASGGGGGGSGTLNTVAMFTPDETTLGDSLIKIVSPGTVSERVNSTSKVFAIGTPSGSFAELDLYGSEGIIRKQSSGDLVLNVNSTTSELRLKNSGALQARAYGSGAFPGTAAYNLSVDLSGNIIETTAGGGGGVTFDYTDSNTNLIIGESVTYTTQQGNVGLGEGALENQTGSSFNTAIGYQSLQYSISGSGQNTALGYRALQGVTAVTDGFYNVAVGYEAGMRIESAQNNVFAGYQAGDQVTDGNTNVIIGSLAGGAITVHDDNVIIGSSAASALTGNKNVVIGKSAYTTASSTGDNNIVIGFNAEPSTNTVDNEITIGDSNITALRLPGLQASASDGDVLTYSSSSQKITLQPSSGGGGDTYDLNAGAKSGNSVPLNLTSGSGTDNSLVNLTEGSNVQLTQTSTNEITISSTGGTVTGAWQTLNRTFTGSELVNAFNGNNADKITLVTVNANEIVSLGFCNFICKAGTTGTTNYNNTGNELHVIPENTTATFGVRIETNLLETQNIDQLSSNIPNFPARANTNSGNRPIGADLVLGNTPSQAANITQGDREFIIQITYRITNF
jgi:hypothetical protein